MERTDLQKINISTLVSIVIYGASELGYQLTKTLTTQGSRVIIIDHYTKQTKEIVTQLKKLPNVDFVDFQGIEELFNTLKRFDYLFYLQSEFLAKDQQYRSKDFLKESNTLNVALKNSSKYNAKVALITSLELNRSLVEAISSASPSQPSPYSAEEIQKYAETVTAEFHDKSSLNARIIRIGTVLGASNRIFNDPSLDALLKSAVEKAQIEIIGDGLKTHYLIELEDAIYGILRMTFKKETNGEVITLAQNKDFTTLSIAYKLLELNVPAQTIRFLPPKGDEPLMITQYSPANFPDAYGWNPNLTLEQSLIKEIEVRNSKAGRRWSNPMDNQKFNLGAKENSAQESTTKTSDTLSQATNLTTMTASSQKTPTEVGNEPASQTPSDQLFYRRQKSEVTGPTKVKSNYTVEKTMFGRVIDFITTPFRVAKQEAEVKKVEIAKKTTEDWIRIGVLTTILLFIFYILIAPIINLAIGGYLIQKELKSAYKEIESFDLKAAQPHLENVIVYYERTEPSFKRLSWAFTITGQREFYSSLSQVYYGAGYGADGARDLVVALDPLARYIKEFKPAISIDDTTPTTTAQYRDQLSELRSNRALIASATYKIGLASEVIENLDTQTFPKWMQSSVADVKEYNRQGFDLLSPFEKTVSFLPELLGIDGRQRYLILLQNPSELRSTGGWLSSYAVLGIENGQVMQLDVDDIYNIEGLLAIQGRTYPAPEDMQKALGIENWSFSLVNWDPNLGKVTENAEVFIKDSGRALAVDGIITIDVEFIRQLLTIWNGVDVPGEPETITAENLYDKIFEIHSEFTPGSRQKTTFLANLANEVFEQLLSSNASQYGEVSKLVYNNLEQKHLMVKIKNIEANSYIQEEGWSGEIQSSHLSAPVPIEWNWGANKANLFLERNTDVEINIRSASEIDYTYKVAIKNNSKANAYPEGDYINYHRLYLPENAQIVSTTGFEENKYDIYIKDGYKVIGGWFNVGSQKIRQLEIKYRIVEDSSLTFPIDTQASTTVFEGTVFKQPGLMEDPYTLTINYPDNWATKSFVGFDKGIGQLYKSFDLNKDLDFRIVWEFK